MITYPTVGGVDIKAWTEGVEFEDQARKQVENVAKMPFVWPHVAVMPDVHAGIGATVGSVIPTVRCIIPAAVGVDIGCGITAWETGLDAKHLPENLDDLRSKIEAAIPHGRTNNGGSGDKGAWPEDNKRLDDWFPGQLQYQYALLMERYPKLAHTAIWKQIGTLGTGNHFIELCLDERQKVWGMIHSGSRGIGNRIGGFFIEAAKREMEKFYIRLPDQDLAYLPEGSLMFSDYMLAVKFAQEYATVSRAMMRSEVTTAIELLSPSNAWGSEAISCHHNYVTTERHFGKSIYVTRKGAVYAGQGHFGVIPGSMGACSYIVRGRGNKQSLASCSHGAGRRMSRTQARATFSLEDHAKATQGVSCRQDEAVLDETPGAYKNIDAVMAAQSDLVDVVHTLKAVLCVKG